MSCRQVTMLVIHLPDQVLHGGFTDLDMSSATHAVQAKKQMRGTKKSHIHNALQHLLPVQVDFVLVELDVHRGQPFPHSIQ